MTCPPDSTARRTSDALLALASDALLALALEREYEHAIIVLDAQARVVTWLHGAETTLGYSAVEMKGAGLERIFTPEDLARGDLQWELRAAESYGKCEDDRWHVRKDGIRIWASGVVTALRDETGRLVGFCKILRDRTDLRSQVEALQSRLENAASAESQMQIVLGTVAHELRGPLGPLSNAAQIIRRAASDKPQVAASLQIIDRQVRYIESLVADLLESTRASVGKVQLHYQTVELGDIIDKAIETCSAELHGRGQSTEVLLPGPLSIDADPVRLQQVFVNIIGNSSKFSPPGSTVWVKATVDGEEAVIRIEDRGRGIPADLLPRIFDLFTQAVTEGGRAEHGLGLGLGLVKSLVELHGGSVQARSEGNDKGTEIAVRLPLRRPHAESPI
jgi:PAS domain S-box-containing protein